jgi:hypothetical protein
VVGQGSFASRCNAKHLPDTCGIHAACKNTSLQRKATGEQLVGYDAFGSLDFEDCTWHLQLYQLCSRRHLLLAREAFVPMRQHAVPLSRAEVQIWGKGAAGPFFRPAKRARREGPAPEAEGPVGADLEEASAGLASLPDGSLPMDLGDDSAAGGAHEEGEVDEGLGEDLAEEDFPALGPDDELISDALRDLASAEIVFYVRQFDYSPHTCACHNSRMPRASNLHMQEILQCVCLGQKL